MSRTRFAAADIDTSLFYDPKVRRLPRNECDRAMVAYLMVVLESWRSGSRLRAVDVLEDKYMAVVPVLQEVHLLDETGAVPELAWDGWYGVAAMRREAAAERQRKYRASRDGSFVEKMSNLGVRR